MKVREDKSAIGFGRGKASQEYGKDPDYRQNSKNSSPGNQELVRVGSTERLHSVKCDAGQVVEGGMEEYQREKIQHRIIQTRVGLVDQMVYVHRLGQGAYKQVRATQAGDEKVESFLKFRVLQHNQKHQEICETS